MCIPKLWPDCSAGSPGDPWTSSPSPALPVALPPCPAAAQPWTHTLLHPARPQAPAPLLLHPALQGWEVLLPFWVRFTHFGWSQPGRDYIWHLAQSQLGSCAKEGNKSHSCQNVPVLTETFQCTDVCPHFFKPVQGHSLSVWDTEQEWKQWLFFSPAPIVPRPDSLSYGNTAHFNQGHWSQDRNHPHPLLPSHVPFPGLLLISRGWSNPTNTRNCSRSRSQSVQCTSKHKDTKLCPAGDSPSCSCLWLPTPASTATSTECSWLPQQGKGLEPSAQGQQSWEMLQGQSWDRVGTGEQILQCRVCAAQGTGAPDIDQNSLEFSTCAQSNGLGYTDGHWDRVRALWVICAVCAAQCIPHWDLPCSKDRKNGFRWVLLLTSLPSQAFQRCCWSLIFPPNSKLFLRETFVGV